MNRIIAGKHRGRKLLVPDGHDVRPTSDRMRERLFSMLMHGRYPDMLNARVADLFAGTGALGLEAISRGAAHATFVETTRPSLKCIEANIATLKEQAATDVIKATAPRLPNCSAPFDFIFMDPPYNQGLVEPTLKAILEGNWLAKGGVIVCELSTKDDTEFPDDFEILDDRNQGIQRIVFFKFGLNSKTNIFDKKN